MNCFYKRQFYVLNKFLLFLINFSVLRNSVFLYISYFLTEVRSYLVVNSSNAVPIIGPFYLVSFIFYLIEYSFIRTVAFVFPLSLSHTLCLRLIFFRLDEFFSLLTDCLLLMKSSSFLSLYFIFLILFRSIHSIELFSNRRK